MVVLVLKCQYIVYALFYVWYTYKNITVKEQNKKFWGGILLGYDYSHRFDQDNSKITLGVYKIPLSIMTRATRQKVNKEIKDLNIILGEWDLIDLHRTSTQQQHNIQFSQVHTKYSPRWTIC